MNELDAAALLLRVVLGLTLIAHGYNHGFGAGGLEGTTRWFASIGLRPARLHATVSTYLEIVAGAGLLVGLLTQVWVAAAVGVMATAGITVHRTNGFFIFRDGYEYVLLFAASLVAVALVGPGRWSLDDALDLSQSGVAWGAGAALAGIVGAGAMLLACWRPEPSDRS